jgi:hypothetical protein
MAGPHANEYMQDNHDVWRNSMDLAGLQNGSIIGFKYLNFEGLAQDTKGVKAFGGFKKELDGQLYIDLTTECGKGEFKIHVKLDDPYKGQEIATVKAFCASQAKHHGISTNLTDETKQLLANLKGKHAIYFVIEGTEVEQPEQPQRGQWGQRTQRPQRPKGLFTLHGFGFFAGEPEVPVVPEMTITVDGQKLNIPEQPIMATNANGYMQANNYQLYAPMKAGAKIEAKANVPGVTVRVFTGSECRATVKATYQGVEKIFLIN